jgi:hypothetical protein
MNVIVIMIRMMNHTKNHQEITKDHAAHTEETNLFIFIVKNYILLCYCYFTLKEGYFIFSLFLLKYLKLFIYS